MAEPYRTSIEIAAPPEEVYPYLTQPDAILRWMGDYAEFDPRPGGEFTLDNNGFPSASQPVPALSRSPLPAHPPERW